MAEIKRKVIEETNKTVHIAVESDTVQDFYDEEFENRMEELDDTGPYAPNQARPFIKCKQNIPILIIVAACVVAHIWARVTVGMI